MAIPTLVGVGTAAGGTGDITPTLPSGWQAGDLFILVVESNSGVTAPSGWSFVSGFPVTKGTTAPTSLNILYRIAQSGDGNPTVTGGSDHKYGVIFAFRGVWTSNPFHAIATGTDQVDNTVTALSANGVTTTVKDCLIVIIGCHSRDSSAAHASGWSNPNLSNLTEIHDAGTTAGGGGGVYVATGGKATPGATGSTSVTYASTTTQTKLFATIALYPSTLDFSVSDSGSGSDGVSKEEGATEKNISDTGSGGESLEFTVSFAVSDSYVGSDGLEISASLNVADASVGTEGLDILNYLSQDDSGVGAESVNISGGGLTDSITEDGALAVSLASELEERGFIGFSLIEDGRIISVSEAPPLPEEKTASDSGSGADSMSVSSSLTVTDLLAGAEAVSMTGYFSALDSLAGVDLVSLTAQITVLDSLLGSEVLTIQNILGIVEAGSGVDAVQVSIGEYPVNISDLAYSQELVSLTAQIPVSEIATGLDSLALINVLGASDSGSGADSVQVSFGEFPVNVSDYGYSAEALNVLRNILVSDSSVGSEIVGLIASLILADTGLGTDSVSTQITGAEIYVSDSGVGQDVANILARIFLTEYGVALDGIQIVGSMIVEDVGEGYDEINVLIGIPHLPFYLPIKIRVRRRWT